jgi:hypothetical protein
MAVWSSVLNLFVVVGNDKIYTSPDGKNWTSRTVPTGGAITWRCIEWSSELALFIIAGYDGSNYSFTGSSSDGIAWGARVQVNSTNSLNPRRIRNLKGQTKVLLCTDAGSSTNAVLFSTTNATSWTAIPVLAEPNMVAYDVANNSNTGVTALAMSGAASNAGVFVSTNLSTWTKQTGTNLNPYNLVLDENIGMFAALPDAESNASYVSLDGFSWSSAGTNTQAYSGPSSANYDSNLSGCIMTDGTNVHTLTLPAMKIDPGSYEFWLVGAGANGGTNYAGGAGGTAVHQINSSNTLTLSIMGGASSLSDSNNLTLAAGLPASGARGGGAIGTLTFPGGSCTTTSGGGAGCMGGTAIGETGGSGIASTARGYSGSGAFGLQAANVNNGSNLQATSSQMVDWWTPFDLAGVGQGGAGAGVGGYGGHGGPGGGGGTGNNNSGGNGGIMAGGGGVATGSAGCGSGGMGGGGGGSGTNGTPGVGGQAFAIIYSN